MLITQVVFFLECGHTDARSLMQMPLITILMHQLSQT